MNKHPFSTPPLLDSIDSLLTLHFEGECGSDCLICRQELTSGEFSPMVELIEREEMHKHHGEWMEGYPFVSFCLWCREEEWKLRVEVDKFNKTKAFQ